MANREQNKFQWGRLSDAILKSTVALWCSAVREFQWTTWWVISKGGTLSRNFSRIIPRSSAGSWSLISIFLPKDWIT